MKSLKIFLLTVIFAGTISSCKDQLDVQNPNQPTVSSLNSESGIINFALGGTYNNGFRDLKYQDGVVGLFWGGGYHDLIADVVGAEAANVYMNQIGSPLTVSYNGGATVVPNPNSPPRQYEMLRANNLNAKGGDNPVYYEWATMYSINNVQNIILSVVDGVAFTGDATAKANTIKAWAHFWKGFAYMHVGSMYYAGIINDEANASNGDYKTNTEILAESEAQFAAAEDLLTSLGNGGADYDAVLGKIIPDFNQVGKGGILSPGEWIRTINTLRARTLLANKRVADMTSADWTQIATLTNNGIKATDLVFTGRSNATGDFLSPNSGTLAAKSTGDPNTIATYKISERLMQSFDPADERLLNNFVSDRISPWVGNVDRGNIFNTSWELLDGGTGMDGVITYSNKEPGASEIYLTGSFEENELMSAEAAIKNGSVDAGVVSLNKVRLYQGSTISSPSGLTAADAYLQLRSERKVALLFRRLALYDARRWGVMDNGGGPSNAIVIDNAGKTWFDATINYDYMDYWDVPDSELTYNPPNAGSAATSNPKQ